MLTEREVELLEFENSWTGPAMRKLDQVRRRFDLSAARYIQIIHRLCSTPEVERQYPQLVHRTLKRLDR